MGAYIVYIIGCALIAALAIVIGMICNKFGVERDDAEQMEYLSRYSEAKRARKSVPIFLRDQAD